MPAKPQSSSQPQLSSGFVGDRLYQDLITFIEQAQPHQRVASGRELSRQYDVSHGTVNSVITHLADEGLLYTVHGRGSFVAERPASDASISPDDPAAQTLVYAYVPAIMDQAYGARLMHGVVETARNADLKLQVWDYIAGDGYKVTNEALIASAQAGISSFILPWLEEPVHQKMREANPDLRALVTASVQPGQRIASVLLDFQDMGEQAASYLLENDCRRTMAVYRNPQFGEAMQAAYRRARKPRPTLVEYRRHEQTLDVCRAILKAEPDGLAFSDDRGALTILRVLAEHDPGFLKSVKVASHATAGELLLPMSVARIESDAYEIGATAVATLAAMKAGDGLSRAEVRIKSRLVRPHAEAIAPLLSEAMAQGNDAKLLDAS